ncbi:MAG TPA: hypothetical protein VNW15_08360 [Rhizomicrobium sp.]|jgi:hypothetical protein|nr:hypothetical protein [Rhizomicrobium sp.]
MSLTRAEARKIALATPGASEGPYFGKPAIFLGEDYLCRVHDKEFAVVLRTGSMEMREVMLDAEPGLFYITDHYKSFPVILARLSALDKKTLKNLLAARILRLQQKPARRRPKKRVTKAKKKARG